MILPSTAVKKFLSGFNQSCCNLFLEIIRVHIFSAITKLPTKTPSGFLILQSASRHSGKTEMKNTGISAKMKCPELHTQGNWGFTRRCAFVCAFFGLKGRRSKIANTLGSA